jgi:hypothetical protein
MKYLRKHIGFKLLLTAFTLLMLLYANNIGSATEKVIIHDLSTYEDIDHAR